MSLAPVLKKAIVVSRGSGAHACPSSMQILIMFRVNGGSLDAIASILSIHLFLLPIAEYDVEGVGGRRGPTEKTRTNVRVSRKQPQNVVGLDETKENTKVRSVTHSSSLHVSSLVTKRQEVLPPWPDTSP